MGGGWGVTNLRLFLKDRFLLDGFPYYAICIITCIHWITTSPLEKSLTKNIVLAFAPLGEKVSRGFSPPDVNLSSGITSPGVFDRDRITCTICTKTHEYRLLK